MTSTPARIAAPAIRETGAPAARIAVSSRPRASPPRPSSPPMRVEAGSRAYIRSGIRISTNVSAAV